MLFMFDKTIFKKSSIFVRLLALTEDERRPKKLNMYGFIKQILKN